VASIRDDEDALLVGVYLGGLASIAFLPFLSALWRVLRREERGGVFSGAVLAAGILTVAGVLAANGAVVSLVEAVDEGYGADAVQALIALDNTLFLAAAFGFAAFYGAAAVAILTTGALARWLGWAAAVIGVLVVVGLLGPFSESDDGGALGVLVFIGFLAGLAWTLATSIVLLIRTAGTAGRVPPEESLGPG
jgi:hypothetical protein